VINREEYYNCLYAYEVNEENPPPCMKNFTQKSLQKYLIALIQNQMTAEYAFKKLD